MKIAIVGLTHLGVCLSVAAHQWGAQVVAFDTDAGRVADVRAARFGAAEPGVTDFLSQVNPRYLVTGEIDAIHDSDLVFIAVDTTLLESGENDDREVVKLLNFVAATVLARTPIVIASQVRPGFTRAHRKVHSLLFYFMETLIFGRGIERARFPERYVIGSPTPDKPLPSALRDFLALAACPVHIMSYESAELAKLSANFVLAATITAANSLAELAEKVGADWRDIESALRLDSRIGAKSYVSPGLGIGGANIARDVLGIEALAEPLGVRATFARELLNHSDHMRDWPMRVVIQLLQERPIARLGILGMAYKPGTTSTRGGAGIALVEAFEFTIDILVHDPLAQLPPRPPGSRAIFVGSAEQVLDQCDVAIVATPWPEYVAALRLALGTSSTQTFVDPYRQVERSWVSGSKSRLLQLGVASEW